MIKVFIQTYGCQMNEADSEEMFLHLSARGATRTNNLDDADAVLINTCTVRDHAEHRAAKRHGGILPELIHSDGHQLRGNIFCYLVYPSTVDDNGEGDE